MPADDFTIAPTWVKPKSPEFNNVRTRAESQRIEVYNLSTSPIEQFELEFRGVSSSNRNTIRNHYLARYGGYDSFAFTAMPNQVSTSTSISGRWTDGSYKEVWQNPAYGWDIELTFEKLVTT